ncbi:SdpI family protein [Microbacterium testaceum]|uniref:SdpI family protein n=1 Tax=Microbacterium testaceum TaxID=2033 RepID=UPI000734D29C|nr:SdpI family protein [Microbacterium testaceum]
MIGALVTSTVAMVAVAALAFWTARRGAAGTLPRNDFIGIRTGTTRASDEAWIAAHRAGAADLRRSGIGAAATAVLPWAALALPAAAREPAIAVVVLAGIAALIGFSVRAGVVGQRAARAVSEPL